MTAASSSSSEESEDQYLKRMEREVEVVEKHIKCRRCWRPKTIMMWGPPGTADFDWDDHYWDAKSMQLCEKCLDEEEAKGIDLFTPPSAPVTRSEEAALIRMLDNCKEDREVMEIDEFNRRYHQ
jgi:hypothetical protein